MSWRFPCGFCGKPVHECMLAPSPSAQFSVLESKVYKKCTSASLIYSNKVLKFLMRRYIRTLVCGLSIIGCRHKPESSLAVVANHVFIT